MKGLPHSHHLLPLLGIPAGGHLPSAGLEPRSVLGVTIYIRPAYEPTGYKSSRHRVMVVCPTCAKHLSAGRLHQHICPEQRG